MECHRGGVASLSVVRDGVPVNEIGRAVESEVGSTDSAS